MSKRAGLVAVAIASLAAAGCAAAVVAGAAAAGAGGYYLWDRTWLAGNIDAPIERVHRAARLALRDFDVVLDEDERRGESSVLAGYLPDGRRVALRARATGSEATEVRIRVGFWGDEALSLKIFEQTKKHL
ncbi:MAG: DUF3568 family protein [Candidatus Brocadiia bacterium]